MFGQQSQTVLDSFWLADLSKAVVFLTENKAVAFGIIHYVKRKSRDAIPLVHRQRG